jgi:cytoskeletal protein RodZ
VVFPVLVGLFVLVLSAVAVIGWLHKPVDSAGGTPSPSASTGSPSQTGETATASSTASPTPSETETSVAPTPTPSASKTVVPPPPPPPPPTTPAPPPVVHAPTVVLNQTTIHGLALSVANKLRAAGWTVTGVGNWRGTVPSSTVYYPAGLEAAARSLAYQLGVDRIRPLLPHMLRNRLTVILTADP